MKLMIDIDEKTYNDIQSRDWKNGELIFSEEWKAIHNGIPIPDKVKVDEAINILKNTAWLGTEKDRVKVDEAIAVLESQVEPQERSRNDKRRKGIFIERSRRYLD